MVNSCGPPETFSLSHGGVSSPDIMSPSVMAPSWPLSMLLTAFAVLAIGSAISSTTTLSILHEILAPVLEEEPNLITNRGEERKVKQVEKIVIISPSRWRE